MAVNDHFRGATKMVKLGSGAERPVDDFVLTRYACYLIAKNGDPRKEAIAFAQSYFAIQTRKQELIEDRMRLQARLDARERLRESEKTLPQNIYKRGVDDAGFGRIRSQGDAALFGGHPTQAMKDRYGITKTRPLAGEMLGQRCIKLEQLPPEEDIKKLDRRVKSEGKKLVWQSGTLPPPKE